MSESFEGRISARTRQKGGTLLNTIAPGPLCCPAGGVNPPAATTSAEVMVVFSRWREVRPWHDVGASAATDQLEAAASVAITKSNWRIQELSRALLKWTAPALWRASCPPIGPAGGRRYTTQGATLTITTECGATGAENFPLNCPRSFACQRSRTLALRWLG